MGIGLLYILMQTSPNVMLEFIYICKMETNEMFNTMIEATLQVNNKVYEHLTLYYCIKHCSIFRPCFFQHEIVWTLSIVKYSYSYFIM